MTVSRKKHLWFFSIIGSLIFVLVVALVLLVKNNTFSVDIDKQADGELNVDIGKDVGTLPEDSTEKEDQTVSPVEETRFEYIEIKDSCGVHFDGECVVVRDAPSVEANVVTHLRNHVILKIDGKVENENRTWYKIVFDEYLSYPERAKGDWYVAAEYADVLLDEGEKTAWDDGSTTTQKYIIVDRTKQKLFAYDGEELFMEITVSTGLNLTPTPGGTFTVFKKTPSRYMQGPLPGFSDYYDLPGVPWNLYFTEGGAVIHGVYWHDSFGIKYSHGCVNLLPADARVLYEWAVLGTKVIVK